MEYKEAVEWLFGQLPMFSRVGAAAYKPGLDRSKTLSGYFGDPHQKWKAIHVAGTNGKGSVSNLIAAVLQAQGYRVGLYTSPHLVDFRERMRVNGEMISEEEVIDFVTRWQHSGYKGDRPSFFELTMMMAFEWFAQRQVDYAVIEVGMGGRLDSTNIITPILSVITNISFDHTQFLGHTLAEIASEKAGIIKPGVSVVIGEANAETEQVFRARAKETGSEITEAYRLNDEKANEQLECSLKGDYQKKNINTARITIEKLREKGVNISDKAIKFGFRNVESITGFRGRWTKVSSSPTVICDTGHNAAGLEFNLAQLNSLKDNREGSMIRFVIGFVADKDVDHILPMFPKDGVYYICHADIPRAMSRTELAAKCKMLGLNAKEFPTVKEAFERALKDSKDDDIIYVGGSTFIVADFFANVNL